MKSGTLINDGKHSMVYRGIEDIYGNIWQYIDGMNTNDNVTYISYTPSKYAVNKFDDSYSAIGYQNAKSNGYISKLGYNANHPLISLPTELSGSETTYITDHYWQDAGNRLTRVGGAYKNGSQAGLWTWFLWSDLYNGGYDIGARLLKTI